MRIRLRIDTSQLLNYVNHGKLTVREVRRAMYAATGRGRKVVVQQVKSQFGVRTGRLRSQAKEVKTKVTVNAGLIKGTVGRLPHLTAIYEHGATLTQGRGYLHPRPVITPASEAMGERAEREIERVLEKIANV